MTLLFYENIYRSHELFRAFDECVLFSVFILLAFSSFAFVIFWGGDLFKWEWGEVGLLGGSIDMCIQWMRERITHKILFLFSIWQHLFCSFSEYCHCRCCCCFSWLFPCIPLCHLIYFIQFSFTCLLLHYSKDRATNTTSKSDVSMLISLQQRQRPKQQQQQQHTRERATKTSRWCPILFLLTGIFFRSSAITVCCCSSSIIVTAESSIVITNAVAVAPFLREIIFFPLPRDRRKKITEIYFSLFSVNFRLSFFLPIRFIRSVKFRRNENSMCWWQQKGNIQQNLYKCAEEIGLFFFFVSVHCVHDVEEEPGYLHENVIYVKSDFWLCIIPAKFLFFSC